MPRSLRYLGQRLPHHRLAEAAPLGTRQGGHVVDADHPGAAHNRGGRDRFVIHVPDEADKAIPHRLVVEHFAEPGDRHVKADRADLAERIPRRRTAYPPHFDVRQGLLGRQNAIGDHTGKFRGKAHSMMLEQAARPPARRRVDPVFAHPVRPLLAARVEVHDGLQDALLQFRLGGHRTGKEGGIEHLERHAGRCNAHAVQFAQFAPGTAGSDDAKRFPQIVGNELELHWLQYRLPAAQRPKRLRLASSTSPSPQSTGRSYSPGSPSPKQSPACCPSP